MPLSSLTVSATKGLIGVGGAASAAISLFADDVAA
jgi:hypothetical protein